MNRSAQSLGRRAAGTPKKYSAEEIDKRTARCTQMTIASWEGHVKTEKGKEGLQLPENLVMQ